MHVRLEEAHMIAEFQSIEEPRSFERLWKYLTCVQSKYETMGRSKEREREGQREREREGEN
jgi:hypothetical protein